MNTAAARYLSLSLHGLKFGRLADSGCFPQVLHGAGLFGSYLDYHMDQ